MLCSKLLSLDSSIKGPLFFAVLWEMSKRTKIGSEMSSVMIAKGSIAVQMPSGNYRLSRIFLQPMNPKVPLQCKETTTRMQKLANEFEVTTCRQQQWTGHPIKSHLIEHLFTPSAFHSSEPKENERAWAAAHVSDFSEHSLIAAISSYFEWDVWGRCEGCSHDGHRYLGSCTCGHLPSAETANGGNLCWK